MLAFGFGETPAIVSGMGRNQGTAALLRVGGENGCQDQPIIIQPLLRGPVSRQIDPHFETQFYKFKMGMSPGGASGSSPLQGQVQVPLNSEQTLQGALPLLNT